MVTSRDGETVLDCCAGSGSVTTALLLNHRNVVVVEKDENQYNNLYMRLKKDFPVTTSLMVQPLDLPAYAMDTVGDDFFRASEGKIRADEVRYCPAQWLVRNTEPSYDMKVPFNVDFMDKAALDNVASAARSAWKTFGAVRVRSLSSVV
jgi:hypothetical protein